jgi:hypothetical protein
MRSDRVLASVGDANMPHAIHHHAQVSGGVAGLSGLNKIGAPSEHEQVVEQSQKWVAQTFYGTLLKQARNSPFHSKLFGGGRGGEAFGALFDQNMAEHMARGSGRKLVNSIARRIEAKKAYGKSGEGTPLKKAPAIDPTLLRSNHVLSSLRA